MNCKPEGLVYNYAKLKANRRMSMNKKRHILSDLDAVNKYQLKKNLLEQFPAIVIEIFVNLFGKMFQKLIHLIAFMLHDVISDVRCFVICFFKLMLRQAADFFCFFLL